MINETSKINDKRKHVKFKFSLHFTHENKFYERLKSWLKPIQVKTRRNWKYPKYGIFT